LLSRKLSRTFDRFYNASSFHFRPSSKLRLCSRVAGVVVAAIVIVTAVAVVTWQFHFISEGMKSNLVMRFVWIV